MGIVGRADHAQRRINPIGFPLGVIYKFFDDQGNYLAAALSYYAFVAIFPLLLLASSILGFILQGHPNAQETLLNSSLGQFPIIGDQLGRPEGLQGSAAAVIFGSLAALYGAVGLGQSIQNLMNTAWAIPRNSRPNPFLGRLKSVLLLASAGVAVLTISILSVTAQNAEQLFGVGIDHGLKLLIQAATALIVGTFLTYLFRLAAARRHVLRASAPGGFTVAVLWQFLQFVGQYYADHALSGPDSLNKTFGFVLGLMALIYVAAVMAVLGVEVNVVYSLKLWPRALLTPFTDAVDLTEADRRAYAMLAQTQRLKGFETVAVRFDGRDGDTHEIVLDTNNEMTGTGEIGLRHPAQPKPWRRATDAARDASSRASLSPKRRRTAARLRAEAEKEGH